MDTVGFGLILPPSDGFVGRGNSGNKVGAGVLDVEVFGLEASPRAVRGFNTTLSGNTAFIHGEALVLDSAGFRTIRPQPLIRRVGGVEADPERHVGLGRDERLLFVGSDGGEVTLHSEEDRISTVEASRIPADTCAGGWRRTGNETVEVASKDIVEGTFAKSPGDAARLEVVGGGVEDDGGDGIKVLCDWSGTCEIENTSLGIECVVDVEVTLIVEEELISTTDVVGVDTDGGTINDIEVRNWDLCEGMETLFSLHWDCGETL